mgnify:CR=1 FL=1
MRLMNQSSKFVPALLVRTEPERGAAACCKNYFEQLDTATFDKS